MPADESTRACHNNIVRHNFVRLKPQLAPEKEPTQFEINVRRSLRSWKAWAVGKPASVNGACDVLVAHCRAASGGLWYHSYEEWASGLRLATPPIRNGFGQRGRTYVEREYAWDRVEKDYLDCIAP